MKNSENNRDDDSTPALREQEEEQLDATLISIIYQSNASSYMVGRFEVANELFPVVANGEMVGPVTGESYILRGAWVQHPKYGKQFRWTSYKIRNPYTADGIERFLASGWIKGIGKTIAKRIVKRFGAGTIDILNDDIERLLEVDGIGEKTLEDIRESWDEHKGLQEVMTFLQEHGVGAGYAARIYRVYGNQTIETIRENPYKLISEVDGVGFITADTVARSMQFSPDHPERISAAIVYCLADAANSGGHCFLPVNECINAASRLIKVESTEVQFVLHRIAEYRRVVLENERVFLPEYYFAETSVTQSIERLFNAELAAEDQIQVEASIRACEEELGITFSPIQAEAIQKVFAHPVIVLTGGPGTGKTTAIAGILAVADALEMSVELCAPTGRAAKRLSELAGADARTIHRLLEYNPKEGVFQRTMERPLETDMLIVDEMSMVDVQLMAYLLQAVPDGVRLVLVGDVDQLPSVAPGNVLADLIDSQYIETVRLHYVFRQEETSSIISNAHRVNDGFMPVFGRETFFIEEETAGSVAEIIRDIVERRLPKQYGSDPLRDIQVLTPMHKTAVGTRNLNGLLQHALNPYGRIIYQSGERTFRIGDKVMQTKNDYERDIYNGDIGVIQSFDEDESETLIDFDGRGAVYDTEAMEHVTLAYAMTIHKSQGSEYDIVVLPMTMEHRIMLQRRLLYTAMTRAKHILVFVGQKKALEFAVYNAHVRPRYSSLRERLIEHLR